LSKAQAQHKALERELAAVRSSLHTEKEARAGLEAEHTELRQLVEQMREERGGWQERLRTLAAAELKAAEREAAEQKERAAMAKLKEVRAELKELRKQVADLEAELAAEGDARRDEAMAAGERDECKAREGQLLAELRAAELERDAYRKQLQQALASAAEPSAASRAEREAAALRQQLIELQADHHKLQAKLKALEEREKQSAAVSRENARFEELMETNRKLQTMVATERKAGLQPDVELRTDNHKLQATLATTQSKLDELLGQAQQRTKQVELLQQRVEVLTQERAQLLKEAAHAQHVQQLYDKVKDQTHEVQLEAQRVLRTVEQGKGSRNDVNRKVVAPPLELKRAPASARGGSASARGGSASAQQPPGARRSS